jgi:hypothetical protein
MIERNSPCNFIAKNKFASPSGFNPPWDKGVDVANIAFGCDTKIMIGKGSTPSIVIIYVSE